MTKQTVTNTLEADLEPEELYRVLCDATLLPQWAPVFADTVEPLQGQKFRVTKGGETFDLAVEMQPEAKTVDYLRSMPNNRRGGAYLRVTARPLGGSTIVMTVPLGPNATEEGIAQELNQELRRLVRLAGGNADYSCSR